MLHFYPPTIGSIALDLLVNTAPHLIELEVLENTESSIATQALKLQYPNLRSLRLVADYVALTDTLMTFLASHLLLKDLHILPIISSNIPPLPPCVAATMLRVDINIVHSNVAKISGELSKSALGATLASLHVNGDGHHIAIFLAPVARYCMHLTEILLYGSTASFDVNQILAVLQDAKALLLLEYVCAEAPDAGQGGFPRPDARLLDGLSVSDCRLFRQEFVRVPSGCMACVTSIRGEHHCPDHPDAWDELEHDL
ncbi:hypothetical protein B0H11DRAFT_2279888 [Mycena galericulata]|nr:hypothetical protein B0H11DRAFT_2279888 [Mycena galericulata]